MKRLSLITGIMMLFIVVYLLYLRPALSQSSPCPSGDLNCSGVVDIVDLAILLSQFGQSSPIADIDGSGTVTIPDVSILLSYFGKTIQSPPSSACHGVIQNIFSPDDHTMVYLGKALMKVNTDSNTIEYLILTGGYPSTHTVTMHISDTSHSLPLTAQDGDVLVYEGSIPYDERAEAQILTGDLTSNFIRFPITTNPAVNAYAYFGSNFTPTPCDTPLLPSDVSVPATTPTPPVIWTATHETGTADEWRINEYTEPGQDSNYCSRPLNGVSDEAAHSGKYALKMTIDTSIDHSGCRTFRYREAAEGNAYYYSAWFYFPEQYIVYGTDPHGTRVSGWTNLMQFKTKRFGQTGGSQVSWAWALSNRPDGTMYIYTTWDDTMGLPGPSIDYLLLPPAPQQFHQSIINVYPRQWFHLEVYVKQNTFTNYDGRITAWQDGVQIFDMNNVLTRYPYIHPLETSIDSWSMNSYGGFVESQPNILQSLYPRDYTVFVDDAAVSTQRLYPLITP